MSKLHLLRIYSAYIFVGNDLSTVTELLETKEAYVATRHKRPMWLLVISCD